MSRMPVLGSPMQLGYTLGMNPDDLCDELEQGGWTQATGVDSWTTVVFSTRRNTDEPRACHQGLGNPKQFVRTFRANTYAGSDSPRLDTAYKADMADSSDLQEFVTGCHLSAPEAHNTFTWVI